MTEADAFNSSRLNYQERALFNAGTPTLLIALDMQPRPDSLLTGGQTHNALLLHLNGARIRDSLRLGQLARDAKALGFPHDNVLASLLREEVTGANTGAFNVPDNVKRDAKNLIIDVRDIVVMAEEQAKAIANGRMMEISDELLERASAYRLNSLFVARKEGKKHRLVFNMKASDFNAHHLKCMYFVNGLDGIGRLAQDAAAIDHDEYHILLACLDITSFYHLFLVRTAELLQQLSSVDGKTTAFTRQCFGSASSAAQCMQIFDVVCWVIFRETAICIRHYVDNLQWFIAVRKLFKDEPAPSAQAFAFGKAQVLQVKAILARYGFPTNDKDDLLATEGDYLGYRVCTVTRTISLSRAFLDGLITLLSEVALRGKTSLSLQELRSLRGLCQRLSSATFRAQSYTNCISHQLTTAEVEFEGHPRACVQLNARTVAAIKHLLRLTMQHSGVTYYSPIGHVVINAADSETPEISVDASPIGGGMRTGRTYGLCTWCKHCVELVNDISLLELAMLLLSIGSGIGVNSSGRTLHHTTDNQNVCRWWDKGYTHKEDLANQLIQELQIAIAKYGIVDFRITWMPRRFLKLVDMLTRGDDTAFLADPANAGLVKCPILQCDSLQVVGDPLAPVLTIGFSKHHYTRRL